MQLFRCLSGRHPAYMGLHPTRADTPPLRLPPTSALAFPLSTHLTNHVQARKGKGGRQPASAPAAGRPSGKPGRFGVAVLP